ncbi:MAG: hypothetical protein KDD82_08480 [Planctomycetes bacterium]|nr:hypothetical protein [Planctomycetota bacterium]
MKLDLWTLALQAINFLVLAWLLHRLLYTPILAVLARRREQVDEARERAAAAEARAEASRASLEEERAAIPHEREQATERLHEELTREREERRAAAAEEAQALVSAARLELAQERERALADLRGEVTRLAGQVAERLLRAVRSPLIAEGCLEQLVSHLAQLPAPELETLRAQAAQAEGGLEVRVAPALAPDAQERWRERLRERFPEARVSFVEDDALIAGAELRLPVARLRFDLQGLLAEALEELSRDQPA